MSDLQLQESEPRVEINSHKRLFLVILFVGIVLLIGGVVVMIKYSAQKTSIIIAPIINLSGEQLVPAAKDSDADGLSDAQELKLGTLSDKSDTDSDGLDDGTEVNSTKTDPKNAHSKDPTLTDVQWLLQQHSKR